MFASDQDRGGGSGGRGGGSALFQSVEGILSVECAVLFAVFGELNNMFSSHTDTVCVCVCM